MKKNQGNMAVYATLLAVGFVGAYLLQKPAQDEDILENRIWIDALPEPSKLVNGRVFLEGEYYYQIQQSSFRNYTDLCYYKDHREHIDVECVHLEDMHMFTKAYDCDDAPEPFEYCLDITVDGKAERYYSMEGLEIDSVDQLHIKLSEL